jgi:hypothetical protein
MSVLATPLVLAWVVSGFHPFSLLRLLRLKPRLLSCGASPFLTISKVLLSALRIQRAQSQTQTEARRRPLSPRHRRSSSPTVVSALWPRFATTPLLSPGSKRDPSPIKTPLPTFYASSRSISATTVISLKSLTFPVFSTQWVMMRRAYGTCLTLGFSPILTKRTHSSSLGFFVP